MPKESTPERKKDAPENPVSEAEIILWSFFLLGLDGICILIDLTGVGLAIAPFVQGAGTFSNGMWFQKAKGNNGAMKFQRQLIKYISNFAPFLPTLFISFLIEVYIHNHPKSGLAEKIEKVSSVKTRG